MSERIGYRPSPEYISLQMAIFRDVLDDGLPLLKGDHHINNDFYPESMPPDTQVGSFKEHTFRLGGTDFEVGVFAFNESLGAVDVSGQGSARVGQIEIQTPKVKGTDGTPYAPIFYVDIATLGDGRIVAIGELLDPYRIGRPNAHNEYNDVIKLLEGLGIRKEEMFEIENFGPNYREILCELTSESVDKIIAFIQNLE